MTLPRLYSSTEDAAFDDELSDADTLPARSASGIRDSERAPRGVARFFRQVVAELERAER